MNRLKRKFDEAMQNFPDLTKPGILTMIEAKLQCVCDEYTVEEEEAWVRLNGPLPEIVSFGERRRRIKFAPKATVHIIPSRGVCVIPVAEWTMSPSVEPTKEFDGKRFRMIY